MWLFLIVLFVLSACFTIVNVALWPRKRAILLYLASIAVGLYALTPYAAQFSLTRLTEVFSRFDTFSGVCAFQIAEATTALFLTTRLIHTRFAPPSSFRAPGWRRALAKKFPIGEWLALLPGGVFLLGAWCGEVLIFNRLNGRDFHATALQYSLALFLALALAVFALRELFRNSEIVLHLRIGLVFLLLVVAMVAPLVVTEMQVVAEAPSGDPMHTVAALGVMAAFAASGIIIPQYKPRRKSA
jgi:hypothetical protein